MCVRSSLRKITGFPSISIKSQRNFDLHCMQIPSHHLTTRALGHPVWKPNFTIFCMLLSILHSCLIQYRRRSEHKPWKKFNYYSIIWMWSSSSPPSTARRIFGRKLTFSSSISMGKWKFYIPHPYHILWCHWNHFCLHTTIHQCPSFYTRISLGSFTFWMSRQQQYASATRTTETTL